MDKRNMPPGGELECRIKSNGSANTGGHGATSSDIKRGYARLPNPDEPGPYGDDSPGFLRRDGIPLTR